jgi:hypothetical protein
MRHAMIRNATRKHEARSRCKKSNKRVWHEAAEIGAKSEAERYRAEVASGHMSHQQSKEVVALWHTIQTLTNAQSERKRTSMEEQKTR